MPTRRTTRLAARWKQAIAVTVTTVLVLVTTVSAAAAQTGRPLTDDDWRDRIPVVIGAIIVVLIVNGIGVYFILRARDSERAGEV